VAAAALTAVVVVQCVLAEPTRVKKTAIRGAPPLLAANRLAHALYTDFEARPRRERNFARYVFLDEATRTLYADWEMSTGTKRLCHPLVGDLTLDYLVLAVEGDPEQTLTINTPEPASPSAEALGLLASWTGTSATGAHLREEKTDSAG
jgi:hypothetical protein